MWKSSEYDFAFSSAEFSNRVADLFSFPGSLVFSLVESSLVFVSSTAALWFRSSLSFTLFSVVSLVSLFEFDVAGTIICRLP